VVCQNAFDQARWEDYLQGALSSAEREQVEMHLQACAVCREEVAAARSAAPLLRAAYEAAPQPSGAFWTRLRVQLHEEEARRQGGDFWGAVEQLAWRLSLGAAAVVVLLVGVVIGTQLPAQPRETAGLQPESRDIFPEPVRQPMDGNDVLLELAAGRSRNGR